MNCRLATFPHCVEELTGIIYSVLEKNPAMRTGPLGDALRDEQVLEAYAARVLGDPEHFMKSLKIVIEPTSSLKEAKSVGYFNNVEIQKLSENLIGWQNDTARERDALSVAYVMRRRKGEKANDPTRRSICFLHRTLHSPEQHTDTASITV